MKYTYNIRDQMTLAERFAGTNDTYAGKVAYRYCLSCDSVLSERIEYSPTVSTTITSWKRYEYDGLNLLRVDERYDTAGGALGDQDPWRTLEVSTHKPGSLGALIGKRVFQYTNATDSTPNDPALDYTYAYDALGNVQAVFRASGNVGEIAHFFTQDAFGNELSNDTNLPNSNKTNLFGSTTWATGRSNGITEHQTGKISSAFTGLQYFHARWYDPTLGRFVSQDEDLWFSGSIPSGCFDCQSTVEDIPSPYTVRWHKYRYAVNSPNNYVDVDGLSPFHPGKPIVWKCKRRLEASEECCTTRNAFRWAYPFFGHCFLKIGWKDCGKGFYDDCQIHDEDHTYFPLKWCRPTTADPDCVRDEINKPQGEYSNIKNNCCTVANRIIRKCNIFPIF